MALTQLAPGAAAPGRERLEHLGAAAEAQRHVLAINAGSSSLKAALFNAGAEQALLLAVSVERIGGAEGRIRIRDGHGTTLAESAGQVRDYNAALTALFAALGTYQALERLSAVGHRVVHGGPGHWQPQSVTPALVASLRKLVPLAPDHMPQALAGIDHVRREYPALEQVACFDTAFHRSLPPAARMFALPQALHDAGIIRYGFHGLSYESIVHQLRAADATAAQGRIIVAHLGNGASMAAIAAGCCVDTTMGYTPNSGLVMGTRSGDIDPGVLIHLLTDKALTPAALVALLEEQSGLLGVSGSSSDMRDLLAAEATSPRVAAALDLFCYRAKKYLGALAAVLGGLDTLVFTGGIGEKAAPIRERICAGLEFLGIELDPAANRDHAPVISRLESAVSVRVIPTNEEAMIARDTSELLGLQQTRGRSGNARV